MKASTGWLVFAGGALGSLLRALDTGFGSDVSTMLLVNVAGAALLGFVQNSARLADPKRQAFWATGFCGGFTTLSGIAMFTVFGHQDSTFAIVYVILTILLGLVGYAAFALIGKRVGAK